MRLIDADALIQELKDSIYKTGFGGDDFESGNEWGIKGAIERINSAPTVLGDNLSPAHSEWEMPEETRRQLPTPKPPTE